MKSKLFTNITSTVTNNFLCSLNICSGLFHLQMRISFPFLRAKDLLTSLLIMITRSFFTLLYVGVHTHKDEEEASALHLY